MTTTQRPARRPRYQVAANQQCECGRMCRGKAALANHRRACPIATAYTAAYCDAIERGTGNPVLAGYAAATAARNAQEQK